MLYHPFIRHLRRRPNKKDCFSNVDRDLHSRHVSAPVWSGDLSFSISRMKCPRECGCSQEDPQYAQELQ